MTKAKAQRKKTIRSLEEIPTFASEDAEREWWATHDLSEGLYDASEDASAEVKDLLRIGRIERLIAEVLEIIPSYTSGRGSFNNMPPGYRARHPGEWQREFLDVFDARRVTGLGENTDEICNLVRLVNDISSNRASLFDVSVETLSSVLGYMVFEMLIRQLTPAIDEWGYAVKRVRGLKEGERVGGVSNVLCAFEQSTPLTDLKEDLQELNAHMSSKEYDRRGKVSTLDLYSRIEKGRNLMLHGNLTHSFEGNLLVLLIDLIVLHVMRQRIKQGVPESS